MKRLPQIAKVEAMRPYVLRVVFASEAEFAVDVGGLVRGLVVFAPLRERPELFGQVRVGEWGADLGWGGDMELSADTLWRLALEQAGEAMPREEFRAWRLAHKLSLTRAAQALGLSRRMVAYYDSGARLIPKVVRLACKGAEQELRAG